MAFASTISHVCIGSSLFFSAKGIHFIAILRLRVLLRVYRSSKARRSWPFKVGLERNDCSFALTGTESTLLAAENSLSKTLQHSDVRDGGEGKNPKAKYKANKSQAWTRPRTTVEPGFFVTAQEAKNCMRNYAPDYEDRAL